VSQAFASRHWPNERAIGKRLKLGPADTAPWLVVVGVTGNVLYDWTARVPEPVVYRLVAQAPLPAAEFTMRVNGDAAAFADPARAQLAAVDPLLPAFNVMSLSDAVSESLSGSSQFVAMMGMLGLLALAIAVVGVYGVVAYMVAARTREFGVRMALGARRVDIVRLVLRRGIGLAATGIAIGIVAAIAATRLVRGLMFGAAADEGLIWVRVVILLIGVTLLACYGPARRATKADPLTALRAE